MPAPAVLEINALRSYCDMSLALWVEYAAFRSFERSTASRVKYWRLWAAGTSVSAAYTTRCFSWVSLILVISSLACRFVAVGPAPAPFVASAKSFPLLMRSRRWS